MTQILRNDEPSHGGDFNLTTCKVMLGSDMESHRDYGA